MVITMTNSRQVSATSLQIPLAALADQCTMWPETMRGFGIGHEESFVGAFVVDRIGLIGFRGGGWLCCISDIFWIGLDLFLLEFVLFTFIIIVGCGIFDSSLLGRYVFFVLLIFKRSFRAARAARS